MALSDEMRSIRERALAELFAAHDDFTDTKIAWRLVLQMVAAGEVFANRNTVKGTVTSRTDLVAKSQAYLAVQLTEATFQQFLAIFEAFFFDLLRA